MPVIKNKHLLWAASLCSAGGVLVGIGAVLDRSRMAAELDSLKSEAEQDRQRRTPGTPGREQHRQRCSSNWGCRSENNASSQEDDRINLRRVSDRVKKTEGELASISDRVKKTEDELASISDQVKKDGRRGRLDLRPGQEDGRGDRPDLRPDQETGGRARLDLRPGQETRGGTRLDPLGHARPGRRPQGPQRRPGSPG